MKNITFVFSILLLTIITCNQTKTATENYLKDNKKIVGHWTMCEESGGGKLARYNSCLSVIFNENQRGFVFEKKKLLRSFDWQLKDSILIIKDTVMDIFKPFPDSSKVEFKSMMSITKMTIESLDKYNVFFLTKSVEKR